MPIQYTACSRSTARAGNAPSCSTCRTSDRCGSRGAGAFATLQWALTNDLDRIEPGRAQYTHLLDPDDAHVVDDIIVWWVAAGRLPRDAERVEHRAARRRAARGRRAHGGGECTVDDVTAERAVLAVQGPEARALLAPVLPAAAAVGRFRVSEATYEPERSVRAGPPAPATRARTASSCTCPRTRRWRCGGRCSTPASRPPGSAPATRCGWKRAAAARPRARPGNHAVPSRVGMGRALRQGRLPRSRRPGGGEGARRRAAAARARRRRAPDPA